MFSKTLLKAVDDNELSSAIGSAVVLKNFIRLRGAELYHAVPEIVQDALAVSLKRTSEDFKRTSNIPKRVFST